jgi:hypothetical protein
MRVCGASSERRRCLSARHWTSGAAFGRRRSPSPLQAACQLAAEEKTVSDQSQKVNCRLSQQGRLPPIAASGAKSWRFIVQCEKLGNR